MAEGPLLAVGAEGSRGTVHVVGAGLAGLSAAVRLAEAGARVALHEAQRVPGGRVRSHHDPRLDRLIDNGNHLVLSGNRAVIGYLGAIGAADRLVAEPEAGFAFVDLATGERWRIVLSEGRVPWWMLSPRRRIPGTRIADYLGAAALAMAGPETTVAEAISARGAIWTRFWEPLSLAVLNTTPERGSARLLWRVLSETFLRGGAFSRPMLAPGGLGVALVDPAVAWLSARGVRLATGRSLRALEVEDGRVRTLRFAADDLALDPEDRVVLALPPWRLAPLLPALRLSTASGAILNAHFTVPEAGLAALSRAPAILGTLSSRTHWIFRRADVVSLTVSASDALGLDGADPQELMGLLWAETRVALGLPRAMDYLGCRINKERRATFDQSPAGARSRPDPRTPLANLVLAGDATATGLPATIEGAVRSGEVAARLAIGAPAPA